MPTARLIAFVVLSVGIVYASRASLRTPRSHGFYRFFAWEAILALFLMNLGSWFDQPFAVHQLIAWCLLVASLVLIIAGLQMLRQAGKPQSQRATDVPLFEIEKTTQLVTSGIYKYIRHPMYSSLLCLAWGIFFKDPTWRGFGLALGASTFLLATAKIEEMENLRTFGSAYQDYMERSKMFVPYIF